MKRTILTGVLFLWAVFSNAQLVQTVRGKVIDKESKYPLVGVNVVLNNSNPMIGGATNEIGEFELHQIPVGKQTLVISYLGYKTAVIRDLDITSGKQKVILVELEEQVITTDEIVVKGYRKGETLNKMASVSARSFSVAETERYAGSLGDPARMAANYAGVSRAGDDRNDIVIRGNSPTGLQWRLEGINIPNPNHWGASGASGGPVSILNNNTLTNSDFFTGAFPAEFGNALSGVFDLQMRSGNNQKHEFTGQVGFNGFELMAEGPLSKKQQGSYMVSGRYSVLEVMDLLGFDVAEGAIPEYYDVTYKVDIPNQRFGNFSFFGIGGRSYIQMIASEMQNSAKYNTLYSTDTYNGSDLMIHGVSHQLFLTKMSYLYSTLSFSGTKVQTKIDSAWFTPILPPQGIDTAFEKHTQLFYGEENTENITTASTRYSSKLSSTDFITAGIAYESHNISYQDSFLHKLPNSEFYQHLTQISKDGIGVFQSYLQWQHKFTNQITLNTGVYFQEFTYNKSYSFEPRAGIVYEPAPSHKLSIGYGLHSKMQPMFYYFVITTDTATRQTWQTNTQLEFTKAQHLVFGYDHLFGENLLLKVEGYYQQLFNVPVTERPSNFSMLNEGASFHLSRVDSLVNLGTGKNYGTEITLEKYLSHNWYFLFTGSLFDSWYTGSEHIERHTAFAANYVTNVLGGYEYKINDKFSIDANAKITFSGSKRNYYLDEEASKAKGEEVYDDNLAFSEREKNYFRLDFRISLKNNNPRFFQEWAVDFTNLTNHQNVYSKTYNPDTNDIDYVYQQGFFPMFLYRINF
ncbi:MAG: TonB-dependent receptor [Salinivirgaceae bacterium]